MMHRNQSVDVHRFAMTPRADIPRAAFKIQSTHKTTFDSGYLIPVWVDEILPGDTFNLKMTAFTRLATPLFPIMDNMYLETFFFFVPNRLVWYNWTKFMGERENPEDSIDYVVPQMVSPAGGYPVGSLFDHMGLPTVGQVAATKTITHSALWARAYNLIFNEWFRDENLQDKVLVEKTDATDVDPTQEYVLLRRGKRADYFTTCLPWPQKGESVVIPLGQQAPVRSHEPPGPAIQFHNVTTGDIVPGAVTMNAGGYAEIAGQPVFMNPDTTLYADLSQATAATINQLRQSFQVQKLLERDARGGTRYTEILRAHFGVNSPDARLQRPEYLGGGSTPIIVNPVAQSSASNQSGTTTPLGTLAAIGTGLANGHGFTASFVEHGMVIGLAMVRADLTYQQGMRKMWSRKTRYDYYFPAFAMLGEQAVLNKEIYCTGDPADDDVFGYQERWSEYRYNPSQVTGLFRSTSAGTLDPWHLAQHFTTRPTLASTFIGENPPVERITAVGAAANGQQFISDMFFDVKAARPMPLYSVPGLIDHF